MDKKRAVDILVAMATCSTPGLYCVENCPLCGECKSMPTAPWADQDIISAVYALQQADKDDRAEWEILSRALNTYGAEAQTLMVMEEMAELQKELCKHARGKDNREAIAEEIADVQIMLEQMMLLHDCFGAVQKYKEAKLARLAQNLDKDAKEWAAAHMEEKEQHAE